MEAPAELARQRSKSCSETERGRTRVVEEGRKRVGSVSVKRKLNISGELDRENEEVTKAEADRERAERILRAQNKKLKFAAASAAEDEASTEATAAAEGVVVASTEEARAADEEERMSSPPPLHEFPPGQNLFEGTAELEAQNMKLQEEMGKWKNVVRKRDEEILAEVNVGHA